MSEWDDVSTFEDDAPGFALDDDLDFDDEAEPDEDDWGSNEE